MPSNAVNLANLLGANRTTLSVNKLGSDVPPGTESYLTADSLGVGSVIGEKAFVQGSNRLYIWNGTGWYYIALLNNSPTWDSGGQPNSSYLLNIDTPPSDTIINLSASDPEGFPITYSYLKSSSMDSIATVSQDSSVFTISPKTQAQAPSGGSGTINFKASDGINILNQESSFTLVFGIQIEYLLVGGGGGGGDRHGGGGGGGSVATGSLLASASTTYNFTIGSGGGAGNYEANLYRQPGIGRGQGLNGSNTTAFGLTAYGGQGGNTYDGLTNSMNDNPGGGGGGAGGRGGSPAGIGANGAGNGGDTGNGAAGGGGGGAGGNDGGPATNGIGGDGYLWTENNTYYGGGGGGGTNISGTTYAGGAGGGGTGTHEITAYDGTDGTGGGGGGCRSNPGATIGGAGGSGGVVIRFADSVTPAATTGNPAITTSGGYKEYWFKTPGSASITF